MQPGVEDPVQDVVPGLGDLQRLGQQVPVVVHGHAPGQQRLRELVVLQLGPVGPQHAVEQQFAGVIRGEPLQLQLGTVQHDLPEPADLRINVEHELSVRRMELVWPIMPETAGQDAAETGRCYLA